MDILLKKGINNSASLIKELKMLLNKEVGSNLNINNPNFGDDTEKVVKQFQKLRGLNQDGQVGPLTWKELHISKYCEPCKVRTYLNLVIDKLKSQVGVKEATGKNDGVEVESYLKSVGLGKGYAWCQAFLFWGFAKIATECGMNNPMPKTAGVLDNWNKSLKYQVSKGKKPEVGDVFVMDFGKGQGHTGIVIEVDGDYIVTIEGNTSADPTLASEDREGQGVFKRRRKISSINKGFLRYKVIDLA